LVAAMAAAVRRAHHPSSATWQYRVDAAADHVAAARGLAEQVSVDDDAAAAAATAGATGTAPPPAKKAKFAEAPPGAGLAYWRVNTAQLVRRLRNQWLTAHVAATIDDTAARVVAALLDATVLLPSEHVRRPWRRWQWRRRPWRQWRRWRRWQRARGAHTALVHAKVGWGGRGGRRSRWPSALPRSTRRATSSRPPSKRTLSCCTSSPTASSPTRWARVPWP
jgi:hypothetical protein